VKLPISSRRILNLTLILTPLAALLLSACFPVNTPLPIVEETPTYTMTATVTATIEWFSPTATPTPFPTQQIAPTPDFRPGLGEVLLSDDFSDPDAWTLGRTSSGNIALGVNELTIAISEPNAYDYSVRQEPILEDFYLEIIASPTLCREEDEYGLLLRMSSPKDFYRFSLSCDGKVRLDRIVQGAASSPQPWMISGSVPSGAPSTSRLGVWALGNEMRFFINDQHQFTITDPLLPLGNIGVFARSAGEKAVTVNFSDLVVQQVNQ
jgi:hypothetical protein